MSYLYPYGDTQQLNLAWFLAKFKELYEYVMQLDPSGEIAMDAILSRFTEQYDSTRTYIPGDYAIYDGYIYKANTTTGGTFDSSAWDAALPVNDVQGLRILLGGLSTDLTELEQNAVTNAQYTPGAATADGLLRQTKNGAAETVMTVDKEPTENSQNPVKSGAVFSELEELKGSLNTLDSDITALENSLAVQTGTPVQDVNFITSATLPTTYSCSKTGKIGYVDFVVQDATISLQIPSKGFYYFLTVPNEYRPTNAKSIPCTFLDQNGKQISKLAGIYPNGRLALYLRPSETGGSISQISASGLYIID